MGRSLAVGARRNDSQDAAQEQVLAEPGATSLVGEQALRGWQGPRHQIIGSGIVRGLPAGQDEADRASLIVL